MIDPNNIVGVLLAGGLARRMGGGDKCLQVLGGKSLLAHSIDKAKPQLGPLIINAAGDASRFNDFGLPVVPDVIEGFAGPLAGVLTGMEWAKQHAQACKWIVTFPTDAPFFPADLVSRLIKAVSDNGDDMACARSNGRTHPVFALWPVRLAGELRKAMVEEDMRKIDSWTARYTLVPVDWTTAPFDPFFNINRPEDLQQAEGFL